MSEMMKAMVLTEPGKAEYRSVPRPVCEPGGLVLQVDSVGLCGSDVRTYTHGHSKITYPAIIGHENAGTIVEVGPDVAGQWQVGQKVVVNPAIYCGRCYYCRHDDRSGLCQDLHVYGNDIPGSFAQYMAIPAIGVSNGQLLPCPEGISTDEIILAESMSSVYKAQRQLRVGVGETVVIIGAGPIGCLHAQLAAIRGAVNIIQADLVQSRLDQVAPYGATRLVNSGQEDLGKIVKDVTDGRGADVVIVAAPSTEPHQPALEMLRKEGRLSFFGGVSKSNPWTTVDANLIHYNRLEIRGAYSYSMADFQAAWDLVVAGKVDRSLITHRIPLSEMAKGLELIASGQAIKVVMKPGMEGN